MFTVQVGQTNLDGTGSSENLTADNEVLSQENTQVEVDGTTALHTDTPNDIISTEAAHWNARGAKEVKILAKDTDVYTKNFVDADVDLQSSTLGVNVSLENLKRGQINTGDGSDNINVSIYTNGGWSGLVSIDAGNGDNSIMFTNEWNSKYTTLDVKTGHGNDVVDISGLQASDFDASGRVIDLGHGHNQFEGSDGAETVTGWNGIDIINSGGGDDIINTGDQNDIITADGGNNTIDAGNGADTITTGAGNDSIIGGDGSDTINAGDGNNSVYGGHNADIITTGAGNDYIDGGEDNDTIDAGAGDDVVVYHFQDKSVQGGEGFDALIIGDRANLQGNSGVSGFEAFIGESGSNQDLKLDIDDGLVIALGGDDGDKLSFQGGQSFSLDNDAVLEANQIALLESQGVDIDSLVAYQDSNSGSTVWSDVDLLS